MPVGEGQGVCGTHLADIHVIVNPRRRRLGLLLLVEEIAPIPDEANNGKCDGSIVECLELQVLDLAVELGDDGREYAWVICVDEDQLRYAIVCVSEPDDMVGAPREPVGIVHLTVVGQLPGDTRG